MDKKNDQSFTENIAKKFKFLSTLKNYIVSKIRSEKYELGGDSKQEVSIVSYDQRSFDDVEREFDFQDTDSIKINRKVFETLKKVLNNKICSNNLQNKAQMELLDIVEKTFSRQLDIFEGLLKLMNSKNRDSENMNKLKRQLKSNPVSEESVDAFINEVIKNLVGELTMSLTGSEKINIQFVESSEASSMPQIQEEAVSKYKKT